MEKSYFKPYNELSGMRSSRQNNIPFKGGTNILADNAIGNLNWTISNPPKPNENGLSYKRLGVIGDGSCFFHAIAKGVSDVYKMSYDTFDSITEDLLTRFENETNNAITFDGFFNKFRNRKNPNELYIIIHHQAFYDQLARFRIAYITNLRNDISLYVSGKADSNGKMLSLILKYLRGSISFYEDEILSSLGPEVKPFVSKKEVANQALEKLRVDLELELRSLQAVQPDFILLLSDYINYDIYLLRDRDLNSNTGTSPLYGGASIHAPVLGPADMRPLNDPNKNKPNRSAIVIIAIGDVHYEIIVKTNGHIVNPVFEWDEPIIRTLYNFLLNLRSMPE
jgi:hypothetical protein